MELHGGSLSIESEKGAGATVTAKFPKAKAD
jgi:signal transduction histidine kinase